MTLYFLSTTSRLDTSNLFETRFLKKSSGIIRLMSTWSGKTLGKVLIGDLIARGGMAEVYYGTHSTLQRDVAVKIMRDHVEEDPESRARFDREARVVANLSHPNIIQIFDYDLVDGRPCIVMELVSGLSLANYLKALHNRGERLPHKTIARLLAPIASALDYAHERKLVHRDIKPANILLRTKSGGVDLNATLDDDIEPVLTDFGLVRMLDSSIQTSTGTVSGTPSYMSPEQARGDRVDRRTDLYSLGVVLYEMLAGVVPFDAESSFGVLMKHLNEPPPTISGISPAMQAMVSRALAKDPAHRYDSASEMIEEFSAILEGKAISKKTEQVQDILNAPAETAKMAAIPAAASRLPLFAGGGALLLALIVFAAMWFFRSRGPAPKVLDPNLPVGFVNYDDFNGLLDKASITINGLPLPGPGTRYEVWYLSQGKVLRSVGTVNFNGTSGQLTYTDPDGVSMLSQFDQIDITLEPVDDPYPDEPESEAVASSVFPPQALVHVRHLLVSISSTPDGVALIQGLWDTADTVNTSTIELEEAFDEGDEKTMRVKTEEIINQLVGDQNLDLYQDWDGDSEIADPSDGYGLLLNGDPGSNIDQGYIPQSIAHAELAAQTPDATDNILQRSEEVITCTNNMENWGRQLLKLTLGLQTMPFGSGMEATIAEISVLSDQMVFGEDKDGNKRIDPIPGEGGADCAYQHAYFMADMPLLPGSERVPPAVQKSTP